MGEGGEEAERLRPSVKAMFECVKPLSRESALGPGLELLFWSLPSEALVFSPISCSSPALAATSNCSGKVLEKEKFTVFLRLIAFELEACLLKQCNSLQMLFAFHFIIACHAMFFESLLIYYLFHFFHFPFFCMLFLLFLPFLQSSVPVCRHNGDDRTGGSRLVSHSCLSYFSALLSGKTSLGRGSKKGKCSLQGKTVFRAD